MILAGLTLLAIGAADLVRLIRGRRTRGIAFALVAVALFLSAVAIDAAGWGLLAIGLAAAWVALVPADGSGRAGLWPVAVVAALVTVAVAAAGARPGIRPLGLDLALPGLPGSASVDVAVLAVGAALFLIESGNIAVRIAVRDARRADGAPTRGAAAGLKGGRLIGPLERLLVFALTVVGAYTLLAAVLAAKGIVRFPEISRDSGEGDRAEYFLVGTLVSWTLGVAAAFLLWWAAAAR